MGQPINAQETAKTQARYNRIAPIYDVMEIFAERRFAPWLLRRYKIMKICPCLASQRIV